MDRKRIIGEVAAKHGVRLGEDDPAFLLVTIAEIALRDAQAEFLEAVRRTLADQEEAAERMQKNIGETLGNSIRRALSGADPASWAIPRGQYFRLLGLGAVSALLLLAVGFAVGAMGK